MRMVEDGHGVGGCDDGDGLYERSVLDRMRGKDDESQLQLGEVGASERRVMRGRKGWGNCDGGVEKDGVNRVLLERGIVWFGE
jgi:hypothetical protein